MTATATNDRAHDLLPATVTFKPAQPAWDPTPAQPFGLSFVTTMPPTETFDPAKLVFDEEAQILLARGPDGQVSPSWKHTSGKTETNTGNSDSVKEDPDDDTSDS